MSAPGSSNPPEKLAQYIKRPLSVQSPRARFGLWDKELSVPTRMGLPAGSRAEAIET